MIFVAALAATAVPTLNLVCTLNPTGSNMSVSCSVDVPSTFVKDGGLKFLLGDQMEMVKVRQVIAAAATDVIPKKLSQSEHDVEYTIPVKAVEGSIHVEFEYKSRAPKGMVYFLNPKECFAGGYNTVWFPSFGDSRRNLGSMTFKGPVDFRVKASGRELSSTVDGTGRTTKFQIEKPTVPTFAAGPFTIVKVPGKVPVTLYLLKPRPEAQSFADGTAAVLKVLEGEFGPYPYPDFAIIETPSPESSSLGFSGASFEGMMFGSSNSLDSGFNLAYFGHEMGHQWWGNLVQMKGDIGDYVFSEGLAQYGSLQVVRKIAGVESAKQYRTVGYPGYSDWQCLSGALSYIATGHDVPLSAVPTGPSTYQHQLANSKGFLAWETLAQTMGKSVFRDALKNVIRQNAWSSVSWDELWTQLQSKTPMDLALFRREWFDRPGLPTVWSEWQQSGDSLTVTIHQKQPLFHLHLPLVIRFKDGSTRMIWVAFDSATKIESIREAKPILSVEIDPDHETLHSTPELDAKWRDLKSYAQVDFFDALIGKRLDGNQTLLDGLQNLPRPDRYGAEFLLRFTLGGNYRNQGKLNDAKEQLERALASPTRKEEFVPLAYLRLAIIAKAQNAPNLVDRCLDDMRSAEAKLAYPSGAIASAKALFPDKKL